MAKVRPDTPSSAVRLPAQGHITSTTRLKGSRSTGKPSQVTQSRTENLSGTKGRMRPSQTKAGMRSIIRGSPLAASLLTAETIVDHTRVSPPGHSRRPTTPGGNGQSRWSIYRGGKYGDMRGSEGNPSLLAYPSTH